jgi:hypothetical protein
VVGLLAGYTLALFAFYSLVPSVLKWSGAVVLNLSLLSSNLWAALARTIFLGESQHQNGASKTCRQRKKPIYYSLLSLVPFEHRRLWEVCRYWTGSLRLMLCRWLPSELSSCLCCIPVLSHCWLGPLLLWGHCLPGDFIRRLLPRHQVSACFTACLSWFSYCFYWHGKTGRLFADFFS